MKIYEFLSFYVPSYCHISYELTVVSFFAGAKPYIIGDKNTPMVLGTRELDVDLEGGEDGMKAGISQTELLTSVDGMPGYEQEGTENPLFRMQVG